MQESRLKTCGQKDKLCSSQMSCGPSPFQFFSYRDIYGSISRHMIPARICRVVRRQILAAALSLTRNEQDLSRRDEQVLGGNPWSYKEKPSPPPLAHPSPSLARVLKVDSLGCFNWIPLRDCLRLQILMKFEDIFCIIFSALKLVKQTG